MFSRLLFLVAFGLFAVSVFAEDFETDIPPNITYSETYRDTVVPDPEVDGYVIVPRTTLKITAVCSMKGVPLNSIDENTPVSIDFEGLSAAVVLGDDPKYNKGETVANIPLLGTDPVTGEESQVGKVNVVWNAKTVTITLTANDDPDSFQVMARDRAFDGEATNDFKAFSTVTLGFAERELSGRPVYIQGAVVFVEYTDGENSESLARVDLSGVDDPTPPSIVMLKPGEGEKTNDQSYLIAGTASDNRAIQGVHVSFNEDTDLEASIDAQGNWSLPVELVRGANLIAVSATDESGNVTTIDTRVIIFAPVSNLKVTAEGTAPGQVRSDLFATLSHTPGTPSPEVITQQEEGAELVITAVPGPASLFDGWTSNYPLPNATSPRLQFVMQPDMVLTARFVPNVFLPVRGSYSGLLDSENPDGRGSLSVRLAKNGAFSGLIRLGATKIRLKGVFRTDGAFAGIVQAGNQAFDLSLNLVVSDLGSQQITGTLRQYVSNIPGGVPFTSSIVADLSVYQRNIREVGLELQGSYNVLLDPAPTNTDEKFPIGIGFGRVTLGKLGTAKLVGKLGDGSPVTASAPLSEDGGWSVYVPLYGKRGSLIGRIQFDLQQTANDLSGVLRWSRPAGSKPSVHGEGFVGQVQLSGAKYLKFEAGQRIFLNPNGVGRLSIEAPAGGPALPALAYTSDVVLGTTNQLSIMDPAQAVKLTVNPDTGLFRGSFTDPGRNKRLHFSGAIIVGGFPETPKGNVAGGYFIRGNRTGAIKLTGLPLELPQLP